MLGFQSWTKAEDIRDFEIEGFSVGESLLDSFTNKEIKSIISQTKYPNDKFTIYNLETLIKLKNYDSLMVTTKKNDKKYIVMSVSGILDYKNLSECLAKQNLIVNDIEKIFKLLDKQEDKYKSKQDKTGESIIHGIQYYFKPYPSNEAIAINCYNFTVKSGIPRTLKVNVSSEEYAYFLINEAYK